MAKTPSPARTRRLPRTVSKPAATPPARPAAAQASAAPAAGRVASKPAAAASVAVALPQAAAKPAKAHKPKLVRDSFTMPKDEYQVIEALKRRALGLEKHVRKSELLRAGIQALAAMSDRAFLKAVGEVPTLKTGRPKAD